MLLATRAAGTEVGVCAVDTGGFPLPEVNSIDGLVSYPQCSLADAAGVEFYHFVVGLAIVSSWIVGGFLGCILGCCFESRGQQTSTPPVPLTVVTENNEVNFFDTVAFNFINGIQHELDEDELSQASTEIITFQAGGNPTPKPGVSYYGIYSALGLGSSQAGALTNDVALLMTGLFTCKGDAVQMMTHWASFANVIATRGIKVPSFTDFSSELVTMLMDRTTCLTDREVVTAQAGFSDVASAVRALSAIFKSDVAKRVIGLLSLLTAVLLYFDGSKPFSISKFLEVEREYRQKHFTYTNDFFSSATQTIDFFLTMGRRIYNGEYASAFSTATPYTAFLTEFSDVAYADAGMVAERVWSKKLEHSRNLYRLREKGRNLITMVDKENLRELTTINNRIADMMITHDVRMGSDGIKYKPFTLLLEGKSGQAKTTIIKYVLKWGAEALNISEENYPAISWSDLEQEYDEKYQSGAWANIIDDIAMDTGKPGEIHPSVRAIMRRANNAHHTVPKAFGDKGKVSFHSQLLVATTNNPTLNLQNSAVCPMAVYRRFNGIYEVELKPEFTKADGTLDVTKALRDDGDVVDMWNFILKVPVLSESGGKMPDFVRTRVFGTTKEFLAHLVNQIKQHDQTQNALLAGLSAVQTITFCPRCRANGFLIPQKSCHCDQQESEIDTEEEISVAQASLVKVPPVGTLDLYKLATSSAFRRTYIRRMVIGTLFMWLHAASDLVISWFLLAVRRIARSIDMVILSPLYAFYWCYFYFRLGTLGSDDFRTFCGRFGFVVPIVNHIPDIGGCLLDWSRRIFLGVARRNLEAASVQRRDMVTAGSITQPVFSFTRAGIFKVTAVVAIASALYACFKKTGPIQALFQSGSSNDEEEPTINGPDPVARNPYYRKPEITPLVTASSRAMSKSQDSRLRGQIGRNLFYCSIRKADPRIENPRVVNCNALKIRNGAMIVPNHAIPFDSPVIITLRSSGRLGDGSKSFELQQNQITRMPEKDIAMFHCNIRVNGSSDLEQYLLSGACYEGKLEAVTYVRRYEPGDDDEDSYKLLEIGYEPLANFVERTFASKQIADGYPSPGQPTRHFGGVPTIPTIDGDCGGVMVGFMGHNKAPAILGFHAVRVERPSLFGVYPDESYSTVILREDLEKLHSMHIAQANHQAGFSVLPLTSVPDYRSPVTKAPFDHSAEIHYKSAFGYFPELKDGHPYNRPDCEIAGTLNGHRRRPVSKLVASPISAYLSEKHGIRSEKLPPPKKPGWVPQRLHIEGVSSEDKSRQPTHLIMAAAEAYYQQVVGVMPEKMEVLSDDEAVNGDFSRPYVDGMNMNSSGGLGFEGPKRNYHDPDNFQLVTRADGSIGINVRFIKEVYEEMREYENCYRNGHRRPAIFVAVDKDELLSAQKVKDGKVRQIFTSPLAFTILVRKYLLNFISVLQTHREVSEVAVGINAMGLHWGALRSYLTKFGGKTCFNGDFKGYDKSVVSGKILSAVLDVIYRLVGPRLPKDDDRIILGGLLSEMMNPLFDFHGTLVTFNMNPSGNPITVIINCIANSIVARSMWAVLHPIVGLNEYILMMYDVDDDEKRFKDQCLLLMEIFNKDEGLFHEALKSFKEKVHLITYGDDNGVNVSEDVPWFNHTSFAAAASIFGIEYTHADKSDSRLVRVPYKSIDDVTFLKRSFRLDPETKLVMAPLDPDSFANMLAWNRKHHILTQEALTASSLESWILESAQHGRDYYNTVQDIVSDLAREFPDIATHLTKSTGTNFFFKSYEEILEKSYGYVPKG